MAHRLCQIRILLDIEALHQILRTHERQDNNIDINAAHEDTHDLAILVPLRRALWWQGELAADGALNRRTRRRDQIT